MVQMSFNQKQPSRRLVKKRFKIFANFSEEQFNKFAILQRCRIYVKYIKLRHLIFMN